MTKLPPRRRFQIHLSTAMILMLVAAALLGANLTGRSTTQLMGGMSGNIEGKHWRLKVYGWPIDAKKYEVGSIDFDGTEHPTEPQEFEEWNFVAKLVFDIVFAIIVLFLVWYFCELSIRRKAERKET